MQEEIGYIPKNLDAQGKWFLWEMDQLVLIMMLIGVGVVIGELLFGVFLGFFIGWWYGKLKSGKHPSFAKHLMYWWFPSEQKQGYIPNLMGSIKTTPSSQYRYFIG